MAAAPVTIKLRCNSWGQLATMYKRDLTRSALFLKAKKPPPLGTKLRINLTLPTETLIILDGSVARHIPPGGLGGRGPGVDVQLNNVPQSAMWLIESALASAKGKTDSAARRIPQGATQQAARQSRAVPAIARAKLANEDASLDEGTRLVEAEGDLVGALADELESLRRLNPFQILDVPYKTNDDAVRAAFARLTKRYHPDRFAKYQSREARECASEIFILIRDAYRRVGNAQVRAHTMRALSKRAEAARAGGRVARPDDAPPRAAPAQSAPLTKSAARPPSRRRQHPTARTPPAVRPEPVSAPTVEPTAGSLDSSALFDRSVEQLPRKAQPVELADDGRSRVSRHSKAEELVRSGSYAEALSIYAIAARRNPGDVTARAGMELCRGLKALAERDRLEAAQRLEAVLELDPTNERAARELAEMRRQATADRKGLLARLLGKKE